MNSDQLYAEILLPLAGGLYSYMIGSNIRDRAVPGALVKVELGPRKIYTGVIWKLTSERPPYKTIRTVDTLLDNAPFIGDLQRGFWEWISEYYMCDLGAVMRAAIPSMLKPSGFSENEFSGSSYKEKTVRHAALADNMSDLQKLEETCIILGKRAKKQAAAVERFIAIAGEKYMSASIPVTSLGISFSVMKQLVVKGVFRVFEVPVAEKAIPELPVDLPVLSEAQNRALDSINKQFETKDTVLLRGVTGSGKTEIYIHLMMDTLEKGKNVLYLLPEIGMTTQMIERVRDVFGSRVVTYHSGFSRRARIENYMRANGKGGGMIIMGTRSSVFLPQNKLGLIVVDEEHDASYKNSDSSPRYNARDSVAVLARLGGAKVLLGSATPSLESRYNAETGKYGYTVLEERYGNVPLPHVVVSDTIRDVKRGERRSHFNKLLRELMMGALSKGEQVMLFQNRRGYSPYVQCRECGMVETCPDCNVAMTFHREEGLLKCHYCGNSILWTVNCNSCKDGEMIPMGFGTEKVETEIGTLFPSARLARLDRDTARTSKHYEEILDAFREGRTDILIGTQMITKGLDFPNVTVVGILNADNLLAFPDFRSSERAFQVLTQMSGRGGRGDKEATVVIQTSQPDNPIFLYVTQHDYEAMAMEQLGERFHFGYPPYARIITLTLRHSDQRHLHEGAMELNRLLRSLPGSTVMGPQAPLIEKIRGDHQLAFTIKTDNNRTRSELKERLKREVSGFLRKFSGIKVIIDIDSQ